MENSHKYFKRDISWLSFNYRVLLEAEDETLPIYERIKFLSIYSSNLEEFYEIRVAEHRGVIMKKNFTEESGVEAEETLAEITEEVNRQQREYYRIFSKVLQELNRQDIYLYQDSRPEPFHEEFVHNFFNEEVFPFLSPVMIQAGDIRTFIRDRRLYLVIRMVKKSKRMAEPDYVPDYYYALMKIPYAKVPRFILHIGNILNIMFFVIIYFFFKYMRLCSSDNLSYTVTFFSNAFMNNITSISCTVGSKPL